MRILGLDVGSKTVGVAVSDPLGVIATGVTTIERVGIRKDTGKVIDYIKEYGCETVVIGLPLSLDGEDSVQTQKVRDFRTMLENKLRSSGPLSKVKVEWQDERYSTVEAEEVLIEANMSREDRKKIIDRQAAIVILQRYLDRMPRKEENDE
ncbi:MAG: Holliday junction resolvase RuvX [Mogibacterium sp.]|nr:Holliday junction resolvase RuvX [Mogibacterium sp.]MBR3331292.1 Holliday junction resolvase RuvX [Mogibacterium sp.]MBR4091358.1 Holliday junction resolvase RuvX [Mogibacterium sp.]